MKRYIEHYINRYGNAIKACRMSHTFIGAFIMNKDFMVTVLALLLVTAVSVIALMWVGYWVAQGIRLAGGLVV
jgi:hypothetical protein